MNTNNHLEKTTFYCLLTYLNWKQSEEITSHFNKMFCLTTHKKCFDTAKKDQKMFNSSATSLSYKCFSDGKHN